MSSPLGGGLVHRTDEVSVGQKTELIESGICCQLGGMGQKACRLFIGFVVMGHLAWLRPFRHLEDAGLAGFGPW